MGARPLYTNADDPGGQKLLRHQQAIAESIQVSLLIHTIPIVIEIPMGVSLAHRLSSVMASFATPYVPIMSNGP